VIQETIGEHTCWLGIPATFYLLIKCFFLQEFTTSSYHETTSTCNQSHISIQPGHPAVGRFMSYRVKASSGSLHCPVNQLPLLT